jgi:Escherichia/Staphylococcus phage prohead protease
MTKETMTLPASEVRFAADDEKGEFAGYASVFGEPDSYGDTIKPGAFKKTLAARGKAGQPAMLWGHDPSQPIGVWTELVEDTRGLKVTGKLVTKTTRGAEAFELLKAGAVTGLSIGFRTRAAERGPNGGRVVTDIELFEISLVTMPAASKARVTSVRGTADVAGLAAFTEACRRTAAAIKGNT